MTQANSTSLWQGCLNTNRTLNQAREALIVQSLPRERPEERRVEQGGPTAGQRETS